LAAQPLEAEALAAAHPAHAHLLRPRALDLDLAEMREVRVLLADDLAVELVLTDRAGKRAADADRARALGRVPREEEALARQDRSLQPTHDPAGHLDVHR